MGSADFKLVKPLPITGDVPFTRASPKWAFDRTGTLVQVPANTLAVTYDPSDLTQAPYELIELEATNSIRNSTVQGGVIGVLGAGGVLPNNWLFGSNVGATCALIAKGVEAGIEYADIRLYGNATAAGFIGIYFESNTSVPAAAGQTWALSAFCRRGAGTLSNVSTVNLCFDEAINTGAYIAGSSSVINTESADLKTSRGQHVADIASPSAVFVAPHLKVFTRGVGPFDITLRIGAPQVERDRVTSPIKTTNAASTRAADVVGSGAGLVYSNVPVTEPAYSSTTTYAKDAIVLDPATYLTYQSLVANNTGKPLSEETSWLPLGATNRWRMFDKAVGSQTTAADALTLVVKPGALANTLALLNVAGSSVTVTQSESGYTRTRSLVTHNVLSWYDWWYEEPLWIGDTVFDDIPPYINSTLCVTVSSPGNQAAIGGWFLGKAKFIGVTQWELTAGILSYSGSVTDKFGNTRLVPRDTAKKMNFEVSIPRGYEDEAYRFLRSVDNVEMVAIATTNWALAMSYGYLGAWEVPLSITGKTMPVEWRGLI